MTVWYRINRLLSLEQGIVDIAKLA